MAINGVSTYSVYQSTINDVSKVESELTKEQGQISSGNASADFTGIAAQSQQYLSLSSSIEKGNQYTSDNQVVESRIDTTSSILTQVIHTATDLNNLISQRRTGIQSDSGFTTQIQGKWQILVGLLNTNSAGRFLFSGSKVDSPAVDANNFPTLLHDGVADNSYYTGSAQDVTVRADDNIEITYNVRADSLGIQQIFAGLATAKKADSSNVDADFQTAYNFVSSGIKNIIATQATVNANKVALTNIDQSHNSFKLYFQGLQQSIGNTDIVSVSTQVAVNQGILQAAFSAFSKINSLRLVDFLK